MQENVWLAEHFQVHRTRLMAMALRMLGSHCEAEDAVQEAWLRLSRSDAAEVENLGGWLTTVLSRLCLDMLRSRRTRREEPLDAHLSHPAVEPADHGDPAQAVLLADTIGSALLMVLETLTPAERLAFVLHDMFAVPFEEIAVIVDRTPAAARQLACRGRRRVQGAVARDEMDLARQREMVAAFLAASRDGDFAALLALLDPDVVLRADAATVQASLANRSKEVPALAPETSGADAVASVFKGRAQTAELALVCGVPGAVWAPGGQVRVAFCFDVMQGKIARIELVGNPERIRQFDIARPI